MRFLIGMLILILFLCATVLSSCAVRVGDKMMCTPGTSGEWPEGYKIDCKILPETIVVK